MLIRLVPVLALVFALPATVTGAPADGGRPVSEETLRRYLVARWLERSGDREGARAEYSRALTSSPADRDLLLRLAELAATDGQPLASIEYADRVLLRDSTDARAHWLRGAALFQLRRTTEAMPALERACRHDSLSTEYLRTLARVAETVDAIAVVERCHRRVVQLEPEDAESWFQLAAGQARQARFEEADAALERSLLLQPTRPGTLFLRGWIRESLGRVAEAIPDYEHHLAVYPRDDATRRRLVLLLARTDRIADAYALASSVVASAPGDAEAIQVMADLAFRSGNPREGERALERMRALHRADPQWVARSIVVLGRHERRREALALAESWVREHPGDASALLLAARAHASLGDLAGAVARARSAVSVAPDSIPSRRLLAKLLQDAGRLEEAEAELGDLRRRAPYDVGVLMDLGIVRERRGDVQGAIALGREALGRAPGSPEVRNYLGYMLADHNRDLEEAERLILAAVAADPDNGAFVDSFGWVLFRLGRLTEARAALERAVLLTRGDPVVHEHLGDVYAALQLAELARQQYRLSLEGDERNVRVRAKLQAIR